MALVAIPNVVPGSLPDGTYADVTISGGGTVMTVNTTAAATKGRLIAIQVIASGTTYTKTAGTTSAVIELWGAGGGGGGAAVTAAATSATGAGGGSGGYLRKRIASLPAGPFTVAIGVGGTGVAGGTGNAGTSTTFNDGTTTYTALGANGGGGSGAVGTISVVIGASPAAVSTNGDVNGSGAPGMFGLVLTTTTGIAGNGGATALGNGARGSNGVGTGASALANTGAGGAGAFGNNSASLAGGAGGSGLIIVWEFS